MTTTTTKNYASTMNTEDELERLVNRGRTINKLAPVNDDCCFGNFPAESRPKKSPLVVEAMKPTVLAEQATALKKMCKYTFDLTQNDSTMQSEALLK